MEFGHDTAWALETAVELINTGPDAAGDELLPDVSALEAFVERREVSDVPSPKPADVTAMRALRGRLHQIFLTDDPRAVAALVNDLVASAGTTPRLTDHDGHPWHIHYYAAGARIAQHLAADCGMALAQFVTAGELGRLRTCAAPDCERVYADLSRNRSKRYCDSQSCGNRLHVAAYRARRAGASAG